MVCLILDSHNDGISWNDGCLFIYRPFSALTGEAECAEVYDWHLPAFLRVLCASAVRLKIYCG